MKLIHLSGDLFTSDAPALAHGVNIDGFMASGIAPIFRAKFPGMYDSYREACHSNRLLAGGVFIWPGTPIVYNLASQDRPGPNARIGWLEQAMTLALVDADVNGFDRIAIPRIGCGIGGLDWDDVEPLLERVASQFTCDIEAWTL